MFQNFFTIYFWSKFHNNFFKIVAYEYKLQNTHDSIILAVASNKRGNSKNASIRLGNRSPYSDGCATFETCDSSILSHAIYRRHDSCFTQPGDVWYHAVCLVGVYPTAAYVFSEGARAERFGSRFQKLNSSLVRSTRNI